MTCLVLLRHGESDGNAAGRFTGWADAPLTERGREQARRSGALLRAAGLSPTRLHTSVLARAIDTGALACEAGQVTDIPVRRSWRLNERHYGALQGRDRSAVVAQYGPDQVQRWRRSYDGRPPPVPRGGSGDPALDPRYAGVPVGLLPRAESLREVQDRVLPYWRGAVLPDLRTGHTVLVVGHSNSLRALIAWVDQLTAI
ncbi:MAG: phosphoglyceromutase, partial [Klenkia sp.]|nr:phosphoglyceromutase [Klenkia sp.]